MKGKSKQTTIKYELTQDEVLKLYYSEPRLAALIDIDVIRLIDWHLVVNLKEFITPKTKHLTAFAKRHIDECCVGVIYLYGHNSDNQSERKIDCTLDLLLQSASFLEKSSPIDGYQSDEEQKKESDAIGAEIGRLNNILNELPGSFSGTLKYHMTNKGYTEELLARESWVSVSTIKQYRQKESKEKTLKTVTALCIGMHLHPWLTEDLLRKAGIFPKATPQDSAYKFLYTCHYKDSIEDCNVYLHAEGLDEFKMREKTA